VSTCGQPFLRRKIERGSEGSQSSSKPYAARLRFFRDGTLVSSGSYDAWRVNTLRHDMRRPSFSHIRVIALEVFVGFGINYLGRYCPLNAMDERRGSLRRVVDIRR